MLACAEPHYNVFHLDLQKAIAGVSASQTVKSLGKAQTTERGRGENAAEGRGRESASREGEERKVGKVVKIFIWTKTASLNQ